MKGTGKVLLAIVNARHRKEWRQAVRSTWLPLVEKHRERLDAFFFVGRGSEDVSAPDVVEVDAGDTYFDLPEKIRAIARWAKEHGYEYMAKCDDDVVLLPDLWLQSGFDKLPYSGRANRTPTADNPFWVPMGFFYVFNKRAIDIVAQAEELPHRWEKDNDDERWVAELLHKEGITLSDNVNYRLHYGEFKSRPLRDPVNAPHRPLRPTIHSQHLGAFAWCIFLEGHSGDRVSIDIKIDLFHKVFRQAMTGKESNTVASA